MYYIVHFVCAPYKVTGRRAEDRMAGGLSMNSSSKELTAMIVNLKEARVLEKSFQTLSLEESYASKLLDLNSKMVNFNYRRLKNNVNKIRTNLTPTDVKAMRDLEEEGKFKAEHPRICSSSSITKIAAAHKRLNLNSYRRAQSAMPRIQRPQTSCTNSNNNTNDAQRQAKQVNGATEISCAHRLRRPKTTALSTALSRQSASPEPPTPRSKSTHLVLEKITKAQKANKRHAPQVTYSCHDEKPAESEDAKGSGNVLDAFGPNPYEERRQKLLSFEGQSFVRLGTKKRGFVSQVERFVAENPRVVIAKPEVTEQVIRSIDSMAARPGRLRSATAASRAALIDNALLKQFAEIRKTRYLRIDESLIDHSGVNTLAAEFMRRTQPWKQYKSHPKSFHDSAQL